MNYKFDIIEEDASEISQNGDSENKQSYRNI